jgi:hypothetical protein
LEDYYGVLRTQFQMSEVFSRRTLENIMAFCVVLHNVFMEDDTDMGDDYPIGYVGTKSCQPCYCGVLEDRRSERSL